MEESSVTKIIIGIFSLLIIIGLLFLTASFIKWTENSDIRKIGAEKTSLKLNPDSSLSKIFQTVLRISPENLTIEDIVLSLIISILFFLLISNILLLITGDILSKIIALAITLLIGISGGTKYAVNLLGIGAGIGFIGIILIILYGIISAIFLDLGFGTMMRKIANELEILKSIRKSEKGFERFMEVKLSSN
jgi:hypothetical protein